ncbi:homeobox protein TGIF2LX [Elysia marginata]|uniref:Homeobox protein TGIF2LX n=1 Tax=Elysia marginata TaxID=1093978 RepID=A0AAV4HTN0_9GAST|nr:homeobox protein TGIF2LX [Elysia marginata]
MEYRDSTSSPSQCSVSTSTSALDSDRLDRLNSPPSPSSPPGPMDDQRLPNELLDEICEDIGMKEGMELDFVEYLMEQDTNPQLYMTPEAISSSGAFNSGAGSTISTPTGSASGGSNSGSSGSNNNTNSLNNNNNDSANKTLTLLSTPTSSSTSTTTPNFLFKPNFNDSDWLSQLPSPLIPTSSGQSSGATTIQSSENNSPANKRIHLSASTDTSPNKGRSQTPPGFNQHNYQSGGYSNALGMAFAPPSSSSYSGSFNNNNNNSNNQNMFKMPQGGPPSATAGPPKRSHSYPQGAPASSPVHSTTSSLGSHSSSSSLSHSHSSATAASQYQHHHHHSQQQQHQSQMRGPHEFSMNPPSDASDQEDSLSNNNNNIKNTNKNNNKVPCVSPKPVVPTFIIIIFAFYKTRVSCTRWSNSYDKLSLWAEQLWGTGWQRISESWETNGSPS